MLRSWRLLAALMLGTTTCAILIPTVIPPPIMLGIAPSLVGAELAPWFTLAGLVVVLLAAAPHPWRRSRRWALSLGVATIAITLVTLVRIPSAIASTAATMEANFGPVPEQRFGRPQPISAMDLFSGIAIPPVTMTTTVVGSHAGEELLADLYQPLGNGLHPVVLVIHGGAWSGGTRNEFADCSRYLAAQGYLVVACDYRLAPRHRFPAQHEDVQTVLEWIHAHAAEHGGDASRIVLLGRSAGSQLALVTAYAPAADPAIRGVVAFYSPVDLTLGYAEPAVPDPIDTRAVFRAFIGGTPQEYPELYRAASPITYATRPLPPTLLINGGRDHIVYVRFAEALADKLRTHGTKVAVLDIPWAEHAFDIIPQGLGGQLALYHLERFLARMCQP
jgi:acetyl esterase/lipase